VIALNRRFPNLGQYAGTSARVEARATLEQVKELRRMLEKLGTWIEE
jgi:hypothetical protein